MRTPEFQLIAWTIKFYLQVENRLAASGRPIDTKARGAAAQTTDRKPPR